MFRGFQSSGEILVSLRYCFQPWTMGGGPVFIGKLGGYWRMSYMRLGNFFLGACATCASTVPLVLGNVALMERTQVERDRQSSNFQELATSDLGNSDQ